MTRRYGMGERLCVPRCLGRPGDDPAGDAVQFEPGRRLGTRGVAGRTAILLGM